MVFDVKYDAWVIEPLAAGILPILAPVTETKALGLPVSIVDGQVGSYDIPTPIAGVTISKAADSNKVDAADPTWKGTAPTSPTLTYEWFVDDQSKGTTSGWTGSSVAAATVNALAAGTHAIFVKVTAAGSGSGFAVSNEISVTVSAG